MPRRIIPESFQEFLNTTGMTIKEVAKISGIDKNHLVWAIEGRVTLDEAHIIRLLETVPGLDTRGLINSSLIEAPVKRYLDGSYLPSGTKLVLKGSDQVAVGDYLRYTDLDGRRYWAEVEEVPDEWVRKTMDVVASGVYMTLEQRHKLWVAVPIEDQPGRIELSMTRRKPGEVVTRGH